jgi:hypothetical protein
MAEKSLFWFTNGFTGATGDGSAPYTQDEFSLYNQDLLGEGVVYGVGNNLAVSGTASPLTVETGRAQVRGFSYWNPSPLAPAVATPTTGTTGGRVVLRADYSAATVRAVVKLNTDGNAGIPALTQVANTTWEISLATFTVTTGGVITVTDDRTFTKPLQRREVVLASATMGAGVLSSAVLTIPPEYINLRIEINGSESGTVLPMNVRINGETAATSYTNSVAKIVFVTGASSAVTAFDEGLSSFNITTAGGAFSCVFNLFNINQTSIANGRQITSHATDGLGVTGAVYFGQHTFDVAAAITTLQLIKDSVNPADVWRYSIYGIIDEVV